MRGLLMAFTLLGVAGCGQGDTQVAGAVSSSGQVAMATTYKISFYAASRFAEQASFGPTPALVEELRTKGFEKWLDEQFALPASQSDVAVSLIPNDQAGNAQAAYVRQRAEYQKLILSSPDQLRARVSWSLSQFITVSGSKGHPAGLIDWMNLLQRQAFGRYGDLLYQVAVHPYMGFYLDNDQNRPKTTDCPHCAPNENFARELMQLFSLGVFLLHPDGAPVRNARGGFVETYSQRDVEELARALTGWEHDLPANYTIGSVDFTRAFFVNTLRPSIWPADRDAGEKVVLGKVFPAGQSAPKDLQDAVALLTSHRNCAPFVALRLIQHLVKSNPSPAYLGRVAAAFRDNGSGVTGDLKAVVKAVLLDREARAGDDPAQSGAGDGYLREPALHRSAIFRALGCRSAPFRGTDYYLGTQPHLYPASVFSFYAPTDRAPGSLLLAPEQKLITASELTLRLGDSNWIRHNPLTNQDDLGAYSAAGCNLEALIRSFTTSPRAFADHLSERYFRGAMPPVLRSNLEQLMRQSTWDVNSPDDGALRLMSFALASPYFGVIK